MKIYTVTTNEELRLACVRNGWFTEGTNSQYQKLFNVNETNSTLNDIVTIIWLCSDSRKFTQKDIRRELLKLRKNFWLKLKKCKEIEIYERTEH